MGESLRGAHLAVVAGAGQGLGLVLAGLRTSFGVRAAIVDVDGDATTAAADDVGGPVVFLASDWAGEIDRTVIEASGGRYT